MNRVSNLKVKLFADGADRATILDFCSKPYIKGFTTNPTLMRKAGVTNYEAFARDILTLVQERPISFEVFADEFGEMERQARKIATWGSNVFVKIPVTNTRRECSTHLIAKLADSNIQMNVTAILTLDQVREVCAALQGEAAACVSLFAGRVADTGCDPVPLMQAAIDIVRKYPNIELIWASPRELLNIFQADTIGCDIITVTNDILQKLTLVGKDLHDYSLDTVKMFYQDALQSGFRL